MNRICVNEKWCLACHLCEYNCAFSNSGKTDMVKALKGVRIHPRIRVEEGGDVNFAVACRHCEEPLCVKGCISGALSKIDGVIVIDKDRCVGCFTCVLMCPYGCIMTTEEGPVQKCELCLSSTREPACAKGCPNHAITVEGK